MNENPAYKSGFATLIGRPNVGKSTLMNRLIGQKIAITSNKPQTTRNRIQTVLTLEEGQIVFLDTPGIHKAKNKLGDYMVNVAEHTLNDVDVILWLVEPTNFIGAGERHIIEQLKKTKTPVILVINKTDTVKKEEILAFIDTYRKELDFQEIVPVSALKGDNTDVLIQCILKYLPYGPAFYDEDTITDQPMRQAETGSDGIQLWYGVYGSPEEPWLALQLTETEPTCRSLGVSGEERSLELANSLGEPVEWMVEPLEGLLDSENRLTVTLADVDLKQGLQPKSPYCEIPLDLTEALAELE